MDVMILLVGLEPSVGKGQKCQIWIFFAMMLEKGGDYVVCLDLRGYHGNTV